MDILCFSHLRWDFVYQRPQHLMSRFADTTRVFYIEEPVYHAYADTLRITMREKVYVITPHLLHSSDPENVINARQLPLLQELLLQHTVVDYLCWFYTPMALPLTTLLQPALVVYDCMDELSAFKFAPPALKQLEQQLMRRADIVFTGGYSLYEAKKARHLNIHPFPSSIDKLHFKKARTADTEPADQASIPHPRLGFYGVLDERFDKELVNAIAIARPEWQLVIIGPVVKIDTDSLPRQKNIHYLGAKPYSELPAYLSGWDVAMIVFALNESTRFISPTKTPEYLAAGKPVISTAIQDVINPYEKLGLVDIAHTPEEFVILAAARLSAKDQHSRLLKTDAFLADTSWDITVSDMQLHIKKAMYKKIPFIQQPVKDVYA
ncbi:glycosyltransferase involved in cell wall biosynthesis [Filimonas zeae]|nr:glycosyltransferase family 1 protein [Filimonas zeae]MDR6339606.1 glycosyltransferase involved in cell wall biosynthesis [Filimonas zeae]